MSYILTFDLGTSGNKTALFDLNLNCIHHVKEDYGIEYPNPGWAEQDPKDFWRAIVNCAHKVLAAKKVDPRQILALSFSCQMNCTIPIREDGTTLLPCISWLDTRASEIVHERMKGFPKVSGYPLLKILKFIKITGGGPGHNGKDPISHYDWIHQKMPEVYEKTYKFLSVKDYIIYKCTKNAVISRDLAHTSWLMNSNKGKFEWSDEIFEMFKLDKSKMPEIKKPTETAGTLTKDASVELGLKEGTSVIVGSGDLISSAIGAGAIKNKQMVAIIGTAAFIGAHTDKRKIDLAHYIGTISSFQDNYFCISKQETGGACFEWMKNEIYKEKLKELGDDIYPYLDSIATKAEPGSKNLIFTPWMFGERSPINDSELRSGFYNLGLYHGRKHLLRSIYEGVAYNLRWALITLEKMVGKSDSINFGGGAAKSDIWSQIMADVLNKNINRISDPSLCAAKGAAVNAMVGLSKVKDFSEVIPLIKVNKTFTPNPENKAVYEKLFGEYVKIYKRNKEMFKALNL